MTTTVEIHDTELDAIRQNLAAGAVTAAEEHLIPVLRDMLNFTGQVQVTAEANIHLTRNEEQASAKQEIVYGLVFPRTYDVFEIAQQLLFRTAFERVISGNRP